jgi:hypothetical protein
MSTPMPPSPKSESRGSLGLGIALAWAALIGGYTLVVFLANATATMNGHNGDTGLAVLLLAPWALMLALIVWFASNNQPRTAVGIAVGIASIVAVALLLVAACFGIFAIYK